MKFQKVENVRKHLLNFTRLSIYLDSWQKKPNFSYSDIAEHAAKKHSIYRLNNNGKIVIKYTGLRNYLKVKKIVTEWKKLENTNLINLIQLDCIGRYMAMSISFKYTP